MCCCLSPRQIDLLCTYILHLVAGRSVFHLNVFSSEASNLFRFASCTVLENEYELISLGLLGCICSDCCNQLTEKQQTSWCKYQWCSIEACKLVQQSSWNLRPLLQHFALLGMHIMVNVEASQTSVYDAGMHALYKPTTGGTEVVAYIDVCMKWCMQNKAV